MENPTHAFRETNLVLQLILEPQIKSKTVMSWGSRNKKEFLFFNICVLSQCIVYQIKLSQYTYFYISINITSCTILLVFKIVESLQCFLKIEFCVKYKLENVLRRSVSGWLINRWSVIGWSVGQKKPENPKTLFFYGILTQKLQRAHPFCDSLNFLDRRLKQKF